MAVNWKEHERRVAKKLNGRRNTRGDNFGKSKPDIEHEVFSIEAKFRDRLPVLVTRGIQQAIDYDSARIPLLVLQQKYAKDSIVCLRMRDFKDLIGDDVEIDEAA